MVSGKTFLLAGLLALVAGGLAVRCWPGDERAIRNQLALIEEVGSKELAEPPVEALVKATRLAALCSDPCRLIVASVRHAGDYPRKQIQDRIVMVRSWYTQVRISLHDITLVLAENNTAVVRGTIRLRGQGTGEAIAEAQEFRAELAKIDGQWLFTAIEFVEVLEQ